MFFAAFILFATWVASRDPSLINSPYDEPVDDRQWPPPQYKPPGKQQQVGGKGGGTVSLLQADSCPQED